MGTKAAHKVIMWTGDTATGSMAWAKIDTDSIEDGAIGATQLATDAVRGGSTGNIKSGTITSRELDSDSVTSSAIVDNSVTDDALDQDAVRTINIYRKAVTDQKIAFYNDPMDGQVVTWDSTTKLTWKNPSLPNLSVTSAKIKDMNVTEPKIDDGAVTNAKIGAGAVDSVKLKTHNMPSDNDYFTWDQTNGMTWKALTIPVGSVGSLQLVNSSVGRYKIATNAVRSTHIYAGAVRNEHLGLASVSYAKIEQGAVQTLSIKDKAVSHQKLWTSNTPQEDQILTYQGASVGMQWQFPAAASIGTGEITADKIGTYAVETDKIANDAVRTTHIQNKAITWRKLSPTTDPTNGMVMQWTTDDEMKWGAVDTLNIAPNAVTEQKIADENITHRLMAANAIEAENIAVNAVIEDKINNNAVTVGKIKDGNVVASKLATVGTRDEDDVLTWKNSQMRWLPPKAGTSSTPANESVTPPKINVTSSGSGSQAAPGKLLAYNDANSFKWVTAASASIGENSVDTDNIVAGAVTAVKLETMGSPSADKVLLWSGSSTAGTMQWDKIDTDNIKQGAIESAQLDSNSVISGKIKDNAVTENHTT